MDPELEPTPVGIQQAGGAPDTELPDGQVLSIDFAGGRRRHPVVFVPVRRPFYWTAPEDQELMHGLIRLTEGSQGPRMIVQDYTGTDIRPYYPLDLFGSALTRRVLYDVTENGDGGCLIDLNRVEILRDHRGDFIHPATTTLQELRAAGSRRHLSVQIRDRVERILQYAVRSWRAAEGLDEARDWFAPSKTEVMLRPLRAAYGRPQDADLVTLIAATMSDLAALARWHTWTAEDVDCMLRESFGEIRQTLYRLRDDALEQIAPARCDIDSRGG
jgi:hypothetical protein